MKNKQWKVMFYINSQFVGFSKIDDVDLVFKSVFEVDIAFKKHIFGSNFVKMILKPEKLLNKDLNKKIIHVTAYPFEGVEA